MYPNILQEPSLIELYVMIVSAMLYIFGMDWRGNKCSKRDFVFDGVAKSIKITEEAIDKILESTKSFSWQNIENKNVTFVE